jgi:hypothetical protein
MLVWYCHNDLGIPRASRVFTISVAQKASPVQAILKGYLDLWETNPAHIVEATLSKQRVTNPLLPSRTDLSWAIVNKSFEDNAQAPLTSPNHIQALSEPEQYDGTTLDLRRLTNPPLKLRFEFLSRITNLWSRYYSVAIMRVVSYRALGCYFKLLKGSSRIAAHRKDQRLLTQPPSG